MLVKLVFQTASKVGRTTGTLYAIGSFGNVLGILFTTYFLLLWFPLNGNMIGLGIALCLTGLGHVFIRTEADQHPQDIDANGKTATDAEATA